MWCPWTKEPKKHNLNLLTTATAATTTKSPPPQQILKHQSPCIPWTLQVLLPMLSESKRLKPEQDNVDSSIHSGVLGWNAVSTKVVAWKCVRNVLIKLSRKSGNWIICFVLRGDLRWVNVDFWNLKDETGICLSTTVFGSYHGKSLFQSWNEQIQEHWGERVSS